MKFLKKSMKLIIGFLIGTILTGGIVYATGQYNAREIKYDTTSVAGALDNLYNYAKNKSDLAEEMNKPNTWVVGNEYNFGDGIYGKRYTGTITADRGVVKNISLDTSINISNSRLISCGGYWDDSSSTAVTGSFDSNTYNPNYWSTLRISIPEYGVYFSTMHNTVDRVNAHYDVWILYTKQ